MYVSQCYAGFPMPVKEGIFEVWGVNAVTKSTGTASRLTLIDDTGIKKSDKFGRVLPDDDVYKCVVIDIQGEPETDTISCILPEPIKTRNGISVTNASNLIGGKTLLYIR